MFSSVVSCTMGRRATDIYIQTNTTGKYILPIMNEHEELGILRFVNLSYSISMHVSHLAMRAIRLSGMLTGSFSTRCWPFMEKLWQHYMRQLIEYTSPEWNTSYGCNKLKRTQRRDAKHIYRLKKFQYKKRLLRIGLPMLKPRCTWTLRAS